MELNGDFRRSPLLDTVRRLGNALSEAGASYAVVGGMAVLHAGAPRTTDDVDIIVNRQDWDRVRADLEDFGVSPDHATDHLNGVEIDVLFAGDDWGMVVPIPDPDNISKQSDELGARFAEWRHLVALKAAVYLAKRDEYGIELAAKDLADVVAVVTAHRHEIDALFEISLHPRIRRVLRRIVKRVLRETAGRGGAER